MHALKLVHCIWLLKKNSKHPCAKLGLSEAYTRVAFGCFFYFIFAVLKGLIDYSIYYHFTDLDSLLGKLTTALFNM